MTDGNAAAGSVSQTLRSIGTGVRRALVVSGAGTAIVALYALGSVLTVTGLSGLVLTSTSSPAAAQRGSGNRGGGNRGSGNRGGGQNRGGGNNRGSNKKRKGEKAAAIIGAIVGAIAESERQDRGRGRRRRRRDDRRRRR